jgi:hypothetical protein
LAQFRLLAGSSEVSSTKHSKQFLEHHLLGIPMSDRPSYFQSLLSRIQELRSKTGRPHWIILDEVHHLLPATLDSAAFTIPRELGSFAALTVHPDHVSPQILRSVNGIIAVGPGPATLSAQFNSNAGCSIDVRQ